MIAEEIPACSADRPPSFATFGMTTNGYIYLKKVPEGDECAICAPEGELAEVGASF